LDLKLRDAVLVIERYRGMIGLRRGEVIDRHILTKDLACLFLPRDQRRAGEPKEASIWKGVAHVEGERVVLGAVRLIGDHYQVIPDGHDRVSLSFLGAELVNECEYVPVIF